jgi:hypothetical protein
VVTIHPKNDDVCVVRALELLHIEGCSSINLMTIVNVSRARSKSPSRPSLITPTALTIGLFSD